MDSQPSLEQPTTTDSNTTSAHPDSSTFLALACQLGTAWNDEQLRFKAMRLHARIGMRLRRMEAAEAAASEAERRTEQRNMHMLNLAVAAAPFVAKFIEITEQLGDSDPRSRPRVEAAPKMQRAPLPTDPAVDG